MIESNNEKRFCVSFYAAGEQLNEDEKFFGEKSKNRDKLIQSGTSGQPTKNRDYSGKTRTVGMFALNHFPPYLQFELISTALRVNFLPYCNISWHFLHYLSPWS